MRTGRLIHKVNLYFMLCESAFPDDFEAVQGLIDDSIYSKAELDRACAEVAYIRHHDKLPEWATVIESFEKVDGAYIFVYRDVLH